MDPELLDRTCKKISQLTRVIYLLNTRNDESDALIKAILKTYDSELENMRKEANEVIKSYKKQIDKIKDNSNIDSKIKDIKKKYDDSCISFLNKIDKFKKEVNKSNDNIKKEYESKYEKMIDEVDQIKKDADKKIKDYMKKIEDEKKK